jgi:hypothetical protein
MGETVVLYLILIVRVYDVLEFFNAEGMGKGNTLLAIIWCIKVHNMLDCSFLVHSFSCWGDFLCRLGFAGVDLAGV